MNADVTAIVERLHSCQSPHFCYCLDGAVDAIEALTEEIEALRAENQRMRNRQDGMP